MERNKKRERRERSPSNIVCMAVGGFRTARSFEKSVQLEYFNGGTVIAFRREREKFTRRICDEFTERDRLWSYIIARCSPRRPLSIFCYDAARVLTLSGFWQMLYRKEVGFEVDEVDFTIEGINAIQSSKWSGFLCDNDPPVIVHVWHKSGSKIQIVDTRNYWRDNTPLVAEHYDQALWVEEKVKSLIKLHHREKIGMWGPTAAAIAKSAWGAKYKGGDKIVPHDDEVTRKIERDSLHGGRVEAFYYGDIPDECYQVDVNSLYPSVMEDLRVPVEWLSGTPMVEHYLESGRINPADCIATIEVETNEPCFPVRQDKRTLYPVGRFITTLPGPELERAFQYHTVHKVLRAFRYRRAPIFKEYIQWSLKLREQARTSSDLSLTSLAKLFGNSLFGKWAQKTHRWESVANLMGLSAFNPEETEQSLRERLWFLEPIQCQTQGVINGKTGLTMKLRQVGHHWQVKLNPQEHAKAFPPISAWITSAARLQMWEAIKLCGFQNVYHVSTDALLISKCSYHKLWDYSLISDAEPGLFKTLCGPLKTQILAPNWFRIGNKWTRSGLPSSAVEISQNKWAYLARERMEETIARGNVAHLEAKPVAKYFVLFNGRRKESDEWPEDGPIMPVVLGK